jgi:hypothetical protein
MKVLFYLRTSKSNNEYATIYVRITVNGVRVNVESTNIKIRKKDFDYDRMRIKGRSNTVDSQNRTLDSKQAKLVTIYNDLEAKQIRTSGQQIKSIYLGEENKHFTFLEVKEKYLDYLKKCIRQNEDDEDVNKVSQGTFNAYNFRLKNFEYFLTIKKKDKTDITQINGATLRLFEDHLIMDKNCNSVYIAKNKQAVRTCINWAFDRGLIYVNPLGSTKIHCKQEIDTRCISNEELELLERFNFDNLLIQKLKKARSNNDRKKIVNQCKALELVRDMYVFGCHTGMAYIDIKKFSFDEVEEIDNRLVHVKKRKKSKSESNKPIVKVAYRIIRKYQELGYNRFPITSNQRLNHQLHNLQRELGIDDTLTFHSSRKKQSDLCTNTYFMSDEATMNVMGHKNKRELDTYRKVSVKRVLHEYPDV